MQHDVVSVLYMLTSIVEYNMTQLLIHNDNYN